MEQNGIELANEIEVLTITTERCGGEKRIMTCGEVSCGFYDAETVSEDRRDHSKSKKKILVAIILCIVSMVVEFIGGLESNSLAIFTDVVHQGFDVALYGTSLFSLWASRWEPNSRRTYGYFRLEILFNLASISMIWIFSVWFVYKASITFGQKNREIKGSRMFGFASAAVLVDVAMVCFLGHGHHVHSHDHENGGAEVLVNNGSSEGEGRRRMNINVQGAYFHALGDLIQSIGVMISAGLIWWKPKWEMVDLICTIIFSLMMMATTISPIRELLGILMETAPKEIDCTRLAEGLCHMEEVIAVHELHVWTITVGKVCLTCHVKISPEADTDKMLDKVIEYIKREYKISHVTIQVEREHNNTN